MMSGFMAFWVLLAVFFVVSGKRRRWRRWANDARIGGRWGGAQWGGPPWAQPQQTDLSASERDSYVEQLETRVARLEERLDFTEKLLMERGPKVELGQKIE